MSEALLNDLDEFTCCLYGKPRVKTVNEMRFVMMNELCSKNDNNLDRLKVVDMAKLPPCRRSLEQHIRRVNFQVAIWKRAHIATPDVPSPNDGHGWTLLEGKLEPLWYVGRVLPHELTDIADYSGNSDEDSNSELSDEDNIDGADDTSDED